MRLHLFGHRVTPGVATAVEAAKHDCIHGDTNTRVRWALTEEDQLDLIEEFGEMFGERIRTVYSENELREWVQSTANKIVRLLGEKLAREELEDSLVSK